MHRGHNGNRHEEQQHTEENTTRDTEHYATDVICYLCNEGKEDLLHFTTTFTMFGQDIHEVI